MVYCRACDKLRCTSCDFKVCSFDNFEWHSDTDYLFLRNNVPDFHRLKSNLAPKNGVYIYIYVQKCVQVYVYIVLVYWILMFTGICVQAYVYMYYIHVYVKPFYITVFLCEVIVNKLWEVCVWWTFFMISDHVCILYNVINERNKIMIIRIEITIK